MRRHGRIQLRPVSPTDLQYHVLFIGCACELAVACCRQTSRELERIAARHRPLACNSTKGTVAVIRRRAEDDGARLPVFIEAGDPRRRLNAHGRFERELRRKIVAGRGRQRHRPRPDYVMPDRQWSASRAKVLANLDGFQSRGPLRVGASAARTAHRAEGTGL